MERSRRTFPEEPVRTADAIHLSTLLAARSLVTELALLSMDERMRRNAAALGINVLPALDQR